jgi:hypothetical protein
VYSKFTCLSEVRNTDTPSLDASSKAILSPNCAGAPVQLGKDNRGRLQAQAISVCNLTDFMECHPRKCKLRIVAVQESWKF